MKLIFDIIHQLTNSNPTNVSAKKRKRKQKRACRIEELEGRELLSAAGVGFYILDDQHVETPYISGHNNTSVQNVVDVSDVLPMNTYAPPIAPMQFQVSDVRAVEIPITSEIRNYVTLTWVTLPQQLHPDKPHTLQYREYDPDIDLPWETWCFPIPNSAPGRHTETIDGLNSNTVYEFRLVTNNGAGESSDAVFAKAMTLPIPPANFSASSATANSITLNWSPQANTNNLNGYVLAYKKVSDQFWTLYNESLASNAVNATISRLDPHTAYEFRLAAINETNASIRDEIRLVNVPDLLFSRINHALTAPAAPAEFKVSASTEDSLTFNWIRNQEGVTHTIEYRIKNNNAPEAEWIRIPTIIPTPQGSLFSYTLSGIESNTQYEVRLIASNENGESVPSVTTGTTRPIAPPNFQSIGYSTNSISLSWGKQPNNPDTPIEYRLQYRTTGNWQNWSVTPGETSTTVTGLLPNVPVFFRLQAINDGGVGVSEFTTEHEALTLPRPPVDFIVTEQSVNTVTLAWTAPERPENLENYLLWYREVGASDSDWQERELMGDRLGTRVDFLDANTRYEFRLQAFNKSGASMPAEIPTVQAPPALTLPGTPANFRITGNNDNIFTLAWNRPPTWENLGNYILEYKVAGGSWRLADTQPNRLDTSAAVTVPNFIAGEDYDFRLTATNSSGSSPMPAEGTTRSVPDAPERFRVIEETHNSITLAWDRPENHTEYLLEYKKISDGQGDWKKHEVSSQQTTTPIPYLDANTHYEFRIFSVNSEGPSPPAVVDRATLPVAPPNFQAESRTSNSVTLIWDPQENLQEYRLEYKVSRETEWSTHPNPFGHETSMTVGDGQTHLLLANTEYDFRLVAINLVAQNTFGESQPTVVSQVRTLLQTPTDPRIIEDKTTANSVGLVWYQVSHATGYEIRYSADGVTWNPWVNNPVETLTETMTNLIPNTEYQFQVRAINTGGNVSEWASFPRVNTLLATPTGLEVASLTTNSVTLNWNSVNGAMGYEIEYRQIEEDEKAEGATTNYSSTWNSKIIFDQSARTGTIDGLLSNTSYEIRIRALHANDHHSDWTKDVEARTPIAVLDPPVPLNLVASNSDTITVEWELVKNASSFVIEWSSDADFADIVGVNEVDALAGLIIVEHLEPDTPYYIRVMAVGVGGFGSSVWWDWAHVPVRTYPFNPPKIRLEDSIVQWEAALDAVHYRVEVHYPGADSFVELVTLSAENTDIEEDAETVEFFIDIALQNWQVPGDYTIRVVSIKADGFESEVSDTVTWTLFGVPTFVSATKTETTSVTVSWNTIGTATGYIVQYSRSPIFAGTPEEITLTPKDGAVPAVITLEQLHANTTYYVRIMAIADHEKSAWSDTLIVNTDARQLDMPEIVEVTAPGKSSLKVEWKALSNASGYIITASTNSESISRFVNADTTSFIFTGLRADVEYAISVEAIGTGEYADSAREEVSSRTSNEVPINIPSAVNPASVKAVRAYSINEVTLTWRAGDRELPNVAYSVSGLPAGAVVTYTTNPAGQINGAVISGLGVGKRYSFTVSAFNENGEKSPRDITVRASTLSAQKATALKPRVTKGSATSNSAEIGWAVSSAVHNQGCFIPSSGVDGYEIEIRGRVWDQSRGTKGGWVNNVLLATLVIGVDGHGYFAIKDIKIVASADLRAGSAGASTRLLLNAANPFDSNPLLLDALMSSEIRTDVQGQGNRAMNWVYITLNGLSAGEKYTANIFATDDGERFTRPNGTRAELSSRVTFSTLRYPAVKVDLQNRTNERGLAGLLTLTIPNMSAATFNAGRDAQDEYFAMYTNFAIGVYTTGTEPNNPTIDLLNDPANLLNNPAHGITLGSTSDIIKNANQRGGIVTIQISGLKDGVKYTVVVKAVHPNGHTESAMARRWVTMRAYS